MTDVLVVIGAGGIGQAIARRQGPGKTVLLGDVNDATLSTAVRDLEALGYKVSRQAVDVSQRASVRALANEADRIGKVMQVVHTAGLSPNMAAPNKILAVDLLGTAFVLEEFGRVIAEGGSAVVISSMAGYMPPPFPAEQDRALALTPADELLQFAFLQPEVVTDPASPTAFPSVRITCACRRRAFGGQSVVRASTPSVPALFSRHSHSTN